MGKSTRKMWQYPWRYKESIAFVIGIIIVGFILQLTVGNFNISIIQYPVNLYIGLLIILFSFIFYLLRKGYFIKWFSGVAFSVTLIGALLLLGLIMGLTPQITGNSVIYEKNIFTILGFNRMTSSWPFIIVYFFILLSLGTLVIRKLFDFKAKNYAFYLNHAGLWILLLSAGLGAADMKRYVMHVREGETEWRVYNENKDILELPVAVQLNDFYMEEYPPKIVVIDRKTGNVQPEKRPEYFHIDSRNTTGSLWKWEIELEEYIHDAVRNSDSTYHEIHMPGASPAAKITVRNKESGEILNGWISAGNISQLYMVINLDSTYCVAMSQPEPKRFVSDINVFTEDGKTAHAYLEVNKPCKVGSWMLYQYDYDKDAGKMSTYSSIELVYDPWIIPVYIGIILFAAGSVCMFWSGSRRKEKMK